MNSTLAGSAQPEAAPAERVARCANCQTLLAGSYCHACGQKVRHPSDYSLTHFVHHALHEVLHFDNKLFRTLRPLLTRPGSLTLAYFEGRQQRYMQPLALFVFINFLFFLFKITGMFQYPLAAFETSSTFAPLIAQKLQHSGLSREIFEAKFNLAMKYQQKGYFIFLVPLFAMGLQLLYVFKKRYYVEHLVFSLHFLAYYLLFMAAFPIAMRGFNAFHNWTGVYLWAGEDVLVSISFLLSAVYLFFALRQLYADKIWGALLKACLLSFYMLVLIAFVYRVGLFFLVLNSL